MKIRRFNINEKKSNNIKLDNFQKVTVKANSIRPYQNDIYLERVFSRMVVKDEERKQILKGNLKDTDIIISLDNYIVDGHHRWAMAYILNPNCEITCTQIRFSMKKIIKKLKNISLLYKEDKHKKNGKLNIEKILKDDKKQVIDEIKNIISDAIENGFMFNDGISKSNKNWSGLEKFLKKLKNKLDISENILDYVYKNLKNLPVSIKNISRKNMPQIKKDYLDS